MANGLPQDIFRIQAQPLTDREIADILRATAAAPATLGQHDALDQDFRISIAGVQEKTALTLHDGQWCKPIGSTPTTHIFKLPLGLIGGRQADMRTSVENEWLCTRILRDFGLPAPSTKRMEAPAGSISPASCNNPNPDSRTRAPCCCRNFYSG